MAHIAGILALLDDIVSPATLCRNVGIGSGRNPNQLKPVELDDLRMPSEFSPAAARENRRALNPDRSMREGCPNACNASASPNAAECLNPWPEQAEAKTIFS